SGLYRVSIDPPRSGRSPSGAIVRSLRSWPEQKAVPAPVSSTARHAPVAAARPIAAASDSSMATLKALRRSGRLSVSVRTRDSNLSSRVGCEDALLAAVTRNLPLPSVAAALRRRRHIDRTRSSAQMAYPRYD